MPQGKTGKSTVNAELTLYRGIHGAENEIQKSYKTDVEHTNPEKWVP